MSQTPMLELVRKADLSQKQTQRLMLTPQMQQALHLLQLPILELAAELTAEIERNPLIEDGENEGEEEADDSAEEDEDLPFQELQLDEHHFEVFKQLDEDYRDQVLEGSGLTSNRSEEDKERESYMETLITAKPTLFEMLMAQARQSFMTPGELNMAEALIGNFDRCGYLATPIEEIALLGSFAIENLRNVLRVIQTFEPMGVGAESVQEALLIQLRRQGKQAELAYDIVERHYDDLVHNRIPQIAKGLKCAINVVNQAVETDIAPLEIHPGSIISSDEVQPIVPDIVLETDEAGKLKVVISDDRLPSLRLNRKYLRMLDDETLPKETKEFIKQHLLSAKWLMRNLFQRNDTLTRIADSLIKRQEEFFNSPDGKLQPLTMKVIADELELHESTIARAVSQKYISCAKGILPLRTFFTNGYTNQEGEELSSTTVKQLVAKLIKEEDRACPLSDQGISDRIKAQGIPCARRTVAKYRGELQLGNAWQRRQY